VIGERTGLPFNDVSRLAEAGAARSGSKTDFQLGCDALVDDETRSLHFIPRPMSSST
jgi:hypothetical protein